MEFSVSASHPPEPGFFFHDEGFGDLGFLFTESIDDSVSYGQLTEAFMFCLQSDLTTAAGYDAKVRDFYHGLTYDCDYNGELLLNEVDLADRFLSYQHIAEILANIMLAARDALGRQFYQSKFEVYTMNGVHREKKVATALFYVDRDRTAKSLDTA